MLDIKPTHKIITNYFSEIQKHKDFGAVHETNIRNAFQDVLRACCSRMKLNFEEEYKYRGHLRIDGCFYDSYRIPHGFWEAKDSQDDLHAEVKKKFQAGYPSENIIFQAPYEAIIFQNSIKVFDSDIASPKPLVEALNILFSYKSEIQQDWIEVAEAFKNEIPASAEYLIKLIEAERKENKTFVQAFESFAELCKATINPNLSVSALEEMLVQHLLTERIFRKVFDNPDFVNKNIIAFEIEKVIRALTSRQFSRRDFEKPLDRFYVALERRAQTIDDFSIKQTFLNTVYEKFFQGFAVKIADTHGIVYTPQPIVDFMVNSVNEILRTEFGKTLGSPNVHIQDSFTGTGNFIVNLMDKMNASDLEYKYLNELHCNEIMLLPYYVASMNIEHKFIEKTGKYIPFPGICLVDTFQLYEGIQTSLFTEENTQRVQKLKETPIFVFISNPPYNAGQVNENDNNKNRKYPHLDKRVSDTYAKDSKATNKNMLQDPYIKAFRYASDEIIKNGEGIVAFVSNNSFIDGIALDGMRKHLYQDFDIIHVVDLKGNIRKDSMKDGIPLGEKHTVFGLGAMVGIAITFLIKKPNTQKILLYSEVHFRSTRIDKFKLLEKAYNVYNLDSREIKPDRNHNWLTEGMQDDWEGMMPVSSKDSTNSIFESNTAGVSTGRDSWAYNSDYKGLQANIQKSIEFYNYLVWKLTKDNTKVKDLSDEFIEETRISWSESLISYLRRFQVIEFHDKNIKTSLYRPYFKQYLYYDFYFNERRRLFYQYFPTPESEKENLVICVSGVGSSKPFHSLMVNFIPCLDILEKTQCFPFFTYSEDGTGRKENIIDWALNEYRKHYNDETITKWDIFYYIYGVLHNPEYRTKYQANLRRSLPRIPYYDDFWKYSEAGKKLADLHVNYEQQPEYPLTKIEAPGKQLDYRVEKMKLSKDKQTIVYNDFLSLTGIPFEAFEYKLGNRSALDWIIDQYQIKTDKRSGIVNDPNRLDEPDYVIKLIGKIVTVSLETMKIVRGL